MNIIISDLHLYRLRLIPIFLLQVTGHNPQQGDASLLPAVHDLPLLLLRADHQDRLPGHHREEEEDELVSDINTIREAVEVSV